MSIPQRAPSMMWSDTDSGRSTSLHALMSAQNHVTAFHQPHCINLSDGFNHTMKRPRSILDSQSHRVIEKRRRDRMNNCLADLGQLVSDAADLSGVKHSGQGRIKKTEIIEMAIDRIRSLQAQLRASQRRDEDRLLTGFTECRDVAMRYLVDQQGQDIVGKLCSGLLIHLQEHLHSIYRVGSTNSHLSTATSVDSSATSAAISAAATALVYGDDAVWKHADQIYVKPEAVTPETVAQLDDDLVSVVADLSRSRDTVRRGAGSPSRFDVVKSDSAAAVVVTSDDGGDERSWHGVGVHDDDYDDDDEDNDDFDGDCSPRRRQRLAQQHQQQKKQQQLLQRQQQQQQHLNGAYKYKDSIKRRFCSESDARSWNESASDCSSSGVAIDLGRRGTEGPGGGGGRDGGGGLSMPSVVGSRPTSPDASCLPASLDESSDAVAAAVTVGSPSSNAPPTLTKACSRDDCCCSPGDEHQPSTSPRRSPGFVLHQSGAYYLPILVTMPLRRPSAAATMRSGNGIAIDISDDDEDDDETSTASLSSKEVVCHPVSIPVNVGRMAPVICGCAVAAHGAGRRVNVDKSTASSLSTAVQLVDGGDVAAKSDVGSVLMRGPSSSAPVLLQRV